MDQWWQNVMLTLCFVMPSSFCSNVVIAIFQRLLVFSFFYSLTASLLLKRNVLRCYGVQLIIFKDYVDTHLDFSSEKHHGGGNSVLVISNNFSQRRTERPLARQNWLFEVVTSRLHLLNGTKGLWPKTHLHFIKTFSLLPLSIEGKLEIHSSEMLQTSKISSICSAVLKRSNAAGLKASACVLET